MRARSFCVKDGAVCLVDGSIADSAKTLLDGVKKAVDFCIDFYEAVKMASQTPAEMLGLKKGRIEQGYDADIVVLNDDMSVYRTVVGGKVIE